MSPDYLCYCIHRRQVARILSHISPPVPAPEPDIDAAKEESLLSLPSESPAPPLPPIPCLRHPTSNHRSFNDTERLRTTKQFRHRSIQLPPYDELTIRIRFQCCCWKRRRKGGKVDPFENAVTSPMSTSLPEDRSFWPFFVWKSATVVSLGYGRSPAVPSTLR